MQQNKLFSILDAQCCEVSTCITRIRPQFLLMSVLRLSQIFSLKDPCDSYISSHHCCCAGQRSSNQPALRRT